MTGEILPKLSAAPLPLKHSLAREYGMSVAIAVLMFLASIAGIVYPDVFYPIEESSVAFVATDVTNLAMGLPILLVSMWLIRRGRLVGLLCWPGALLYVLYIYTGYLSLPIRFLLVPHILLAVLSAYSLIAVYIKIDSDAVRQRIHEAVPGKTTGYILAIIGVLVIAYQGVNIATHIVNKTSPEAAELVQWIDDLLFGCPALLGGGYLLLRRKALGYAAGAGLLLMCGMLFVGVIPAMVFQALTDNEPVDLIGILVVLITSLICFIPFVLYMRGVTTHRERSENEAQEISP